METSGRVGSEKLMIIIPGTVLLFVIVIVTGGPTQFLRTVNFELGQIIAFLRNWVFTWAV